jgi:hypothetical protein
VVPKVGDCIAIFLGSEEVYKVQFRTEPGTYYLTKGWIEAGDSPFGEYDSLVERYRDYSRRVAERFGLRYEEIPGSDALIKKMLHGPRNDEFVVARPGETISYLDFKRAKSKT